MSEPVAGEVPANATTQKKKAGKGLPKGVSGPVKGGKFQGRVTFKPLDIKQRSVGLFETPEAAGHAVEAAKQQLAAGGDPWSGEPVHTRKHKRGEVRCSLSFGVAIRAHLSSARFAGTTT